MKATNGLFLAGFAAAALSAAAVIGFAPSDDAKTPTTQATKSEQQKAPAKKQKKESPFDAGVSKTPRVASDGDKAAIYREYTQWQTFSFLTDVLRSTHIAVGEITAVQYPAARVEVTFKPHRYLTGTPLNTETVQIKTETNADLRSLIGQVVPIAFIERNVDGVIDYGATHGVNSITRNDWNSDASVDFYEQMLELYNADKEAVQNALAVNPVDGRFPYPSTFVNATKNLLIDSFAKSGTAVAHMAARELALNPVFTDALTPSDLDSIADSIRNSNPKTFDRGYGYMILKDQQAGLLTNSDIINLCRDEQAIINLDHLGELVHYQHSNQVSYIVEELAKIYRNDSFEETDQARRNAIELSTAIGSKLALPHFDSVLGKLTTRDEQRALLDGYGKMHHERSFRPLVIYLNGGIPSQHFTPIAIEAGQPAPAPIVRKQRDTLDSRELHKRTALAIAKIDSAESNLYIQKLYNLVADKDLKDFFFTLVEKNRDWRHLVEVLEEGDSSLEIFPQPE